LLAQMLKRIILFLMELLVDQQQTELIFTLLGLIVIYIGIMEMQLVEKDVCQHHLVVMMINGLMFVYCQVVGLRLIRKYF